MIVPDDVLVPQRAIPVIGSDQQDQAPLSTNTNINAECQCLTDHCAQMEWIPIARITRVRSTPFCNPMRRASLVSRNGTTDAPSAPSISAHDGGELETAHGATYE